MGIISYMANPARFLRVSKYATPICGWAALIGFIIGLYLSLIGSPLEEEQGHTVRIMYVHVPAAWCAMAAYSAIAVASLISFVWRHGLADSAARALAVPGMVFTALTLITGSLWGRPDWGTWWQWDGRMTSVLVLLFIYIGYIAIWNVAERKVAARLAAILAMVGWINIPIIKYSVEWWNTLHQPATVSKLSAPSATSEILAPLLTMALAYTLLLAWMAFRGIEADLVQLRSTRPISQKPATISLEEA